MTMPRTLRRLPMTIAGLALLALPFGCGSESPDPPVAEVPAPPQVVVDAAPAPVEKMPTDAVDRMAHKIDKNIQRTAGAIEGEINELQVGEKKAADDANGVKKAFGEAEKEVKRDAKEVEEEARKAAEKSLDNLLGAPPK